MATATAPDAIARVRDFSAGYLETPEADQVAPGAQTGGSLNGELVVGRGPSGLVATLRKRRGSRIVTPAAAGGRIDGLFEYRRLGADPALLAVADGALFAFDGTSLLTPIAGGAGFTAGRAARACTYRGQCQVFDGTALVRYDGTTVYPVGMPAPPTVSDMVVAGVGLTGTYEARYTWYDQATDHESSPSPTTATLALVNQGRRHALPGGVVPTAATHWRVYVRRADTYEVYWYRVATVPVATVVYDEAVTDEIRRRDLAPRDNEHDPPPGPWALLVEWQGFGVGVLADDDQFSVSKQENLQAWHPKHRFAVGRGDGEAITTLRRYGTDLLVQKPHATWRLVGEAVPFKIEPLHSRYGNVAQEAGVEVHDRYYAWDREQGPYVTDTVTWRPLADHRIEGIVGRVTRTALAQIRGVYVEAADLILWAVPLDGQTRCRTILAYQVALDTWLPPWTGLEYVSLTTHTTGAGDLGVYAGDEWGRLFRLFTGDREGLPVFVPDVTHTAVVTGATANTVTVAGATFYTAGAGCAGLPVAVRAPDGSWQWRRIASNTATTLTLDVVNDAPWTVIPEAGWEVIVGGIDWHYRTLRLDFGRPEVEKAWHYLFLQASLEASTHRLDVRGKFDDGDLDDQTARVPMPSGGAVWGEFLWGQAEWGPGGRPMRKIRLERSGFRVQFWLSNPYPSQPVDLTQWQVWGTVKPERLAPSAETT